jgi:hypothetical protein
MIFVRAAWELRRERRKRQSKAYRHSCPNCGAVIVSVHMKNGGWAHFEGAKGLGHVKHPCFHRGEKLGRRRDNDTPDFFDERPPDSSTPNKV